MGFRKGTAPARDHLCTWQAGAVDCLTRVVGGFSARLRDAVTVEDLGLLLDDAARELGFRYHALVHHADLARPPQHLVFLQNYPASWVEDFARKGLHRHDPAQRIAATRPGSFAWSDLPRLCQLTSHGRHMIEGASRAGLGEGFTVPLHVPGQRAASCSFVTRPGIGLPQDALLAAELVARGVFAAMFDMFHPVPRPAPPHLSPREQDCVALMAQGKTDWEIGTILGLSEDTVTQYLKSARMRFGVSRRTQLALAAVSHGQLALDEIVSWQ